MGSVSSDPGQLAVGEGLAEAEALDDAEALDEPDAEAELDALEVGVATGASNESDGRGGEDGVGLAGR